MGKLLSKITGVVLLSLFSVSGAAQKYTARDSITVDSIMTLAMHAYYQDVEQSLDYTLKALKIAEKINYKKGICEAYNGLGIIYRNLGKTDSSEYYTTKNIDARFALKNRDDSLGAYIDMLNLSSIYMARGQILDALELCTESLAYADEVNDTQCMVAARGSLGRIYLKCEEIAYAKPYFLEILNLTRELKFQQAKVETGTTYLSLFRCHLLSEEYNEALIYLDSAEVVFREIQDSLDYVHVYLSYGEIYIAQEKYELAYPYIKMAFDESNQKGNVYQKALAGFYLCRYYRDKGQLDSAKYYGNISYENVIKIENADILKALYLEMGRIYSDLGDHKQANEFLEKHITLKDSLYTESLYRELQAEKFNEELAKQKTEKEKIQKDNVDKAKTILFWEIAGALLLITKTAMIILAVSLYRKRKKYKKAIDDLNRTNEIKNRLLAIISHDLRSPLSSLYSVIVLTKQKALTDEEKERLYSKLEQNLNVTLSLVDNLLYWTKNQINEIKPELENFDINKKVNDAIEVYGSVAADKGIKIITDLTKQSIAYGDSGMINIVIRNLISNAIKFTKKGGTVFITTEIRDDKIRLIVKDTGIGMKPEKLATIFTQENTSEPGTMKEKGTGLGLLVSYDFIEMNNSELKVDSVYGQGTTFYFDLPLAVN